MGYETTSGTVQYVEIITCAYCSGMRCGIKYQPPRAAYIKAAAGVFIDSCALLIDLLFDPWRTSISMSLIQRRAHSVCYQPGRVCFSFPEVRPWNEVR